MIVNNGPYSAHYESEFSKQINEGENLILFFLSRSFHESVKNPNAFIILKGDGKLIEIGGEEIPDILIPEDTFASDITEDQRIMVWKDTTILVDGTPPTYLEAKYLENYTIVDSLARIKAKIDSIYPLKLKLQEYLFYSRPKGVYKGADTKKLLLDFYLVNTEISPQGNKVRATVNGKEFIIDEWVPYYIEGLQIGEVTVKLELINSNGELIDAPFNPVERKVTLE